jgi:phosphoenolpyruvate carboxykinase (GTP)
MANMDFLVVPLGKYIENHIRFGESLSKAPLVFATNYFLKEGGKYLNEKLDKKIWLLWMEGRVHNEYDAIETPIGFIPRYEDLKDLFRQVFEREFSRDEYDVQFSIRIGKFLEKLERMDKIYSTEEDVPAAFYECIRELEKRLLEAKSRYKQDVVLPAAFGE